MNRRKGGKMKRKIWIITVILILVLSLVGCTVQQTTTSPNTSSSVTATTTTLASSSVPVSVSGLETALESIYSQVNLWVVSIEVIIPASFERVLTIALWIRVLFFRYLQDIL